WADALFAGRSHADKEADQEAFLLMIVLIGGPLILLLVGLHALFTLVGLQLGWWSAPVFAPLFVWLLISAAMRGALRPVELEEMRWPQRLKSAGVLLVVFWVLWPLWAGPAAGAWRAGHGGFSKGGIAAAGPRYPLGAVLGASPIAMGLIAFLLLAVGMTLAPRVRERERERPVPPGGPELLRAPLLSQRPEQRPRYPEPRLGPPERRVEDPRWR
ncbi:MAG: hypothetical protein ACRDK7_04920, partial [Solirubrobacteraceae bacterium]